MSAQPIRVMCSGWRFPWAVRFPFRALASWISGIAVLAVAWRLYIAWRAITCRAVAVLCCRGCDCRLYLTFGTLFGRDSGVALLVIMLTLKMLEMATLRDAMIVIFLSYFVVLTNFLFSQTIPTALLMLVGVWVITATMIGLQWRPGAIRYQETLRLSGVMLAQATPLMLVLFLLFPRIQGPLWGLPRDAFSGVTGLSDTMSPGTLISLPLRYSRFLVQFQRNLIPLSCIGAAVLWYSTVCPGIWWLIDNALLAIRRGRAAVFIRFPGAPDKRWLFALDQPAKLAPAAGSHPTPISRICRLASGSL